MRLLKLDPRPATYDSVAEASLDGAATTAVDPHVEMGDWRAITPAIPRRTLAMAFVDGVQRIDRRVSAEGEGLPVPGILASYAAGAVVPTSTRQYRHILVRRDTILAGGLLPDVIQVQTHSTCLEYLPATATGEDAYVSLTTKLNEQRSDLEKVVVEHLRHEGVVDLLLVDGRLPLGAHDAVGFIKTLAALYVTDPEHTDLLASLETGQRSPVFRIERARSLYSWYVCLRTPGAFDLALSGIARLEMDGGVPLADVTRTADLTAALLPPYASTPERDDRAPQNLLPIGQLERELRHQLGDPELLQRFLLRAFQEEQPSWRK